MTTPRPTPTQLYALQIIADQLVRTGDLAVRNSRERRTVRRSTFNQLLELGYVRTIRRSSYCTEDIDITAAGRAVVRDWKWTTYRGDNL